MYKQDSNSIASISKSSEIKSIAFIGSVGIPNCYGGFESFLESVTPLLVANGHDVIVTCDGNRYNDHSPVFRGVKREFLSVSANGPLSQVHDLLAYLRVFRKVDSVVVLGVSAGFFFLIMRCLAFLFGKSLLLNVDGIEWRRTKFSKPVRFILKLFDALGQLAATTIVYDNPELKPFVYKAFQKKARFIAYPGDHVTRFPDEQKQQIALTICRIEPENNIDLLIEGALLSDVKEYIIIGNWGFSEYGRNLKLKYADHSKIKLLEPIYNQKIIGRYRERCSVYLHGHSVGGTNPSLVEMLFYDCYLLCFDCGFNRQTAKGDAEYFSDAKSLGIQLNLLLAKPIPALRTVRGKYTAISIAEQYLAAIEGDSVNVLKVSNVNSPNS